MNSSPAVSWIRQLFADPIVQVGAPILFTLACVLVGWLLKRYTNRFTPNERDILALSHYYGQDFLTRTTTSGHPDSVCAGRVVLVDPENPSTRHRYLIAFDRLKAKGALRPGGDSHTWRLHGTGLQLAMKLRKPTRSDYPWADTAELDE